MGTLTRSLFVAVLMAGWYSTVPIANAQEAPSPGLSRPSVTEQKLDAAATALQRVVRIEDDYGKRLAEAPQADKKRIVAEANDALEKAVADQGLSVEEYSSILEVAKNDPEVRGKIIQRIHPSPDDRKQ
jgi:hypothetical protein